MDANTFAILIHELRNQCSFYETAVRLFNQSLQQNAPGSAFFAAQSALTSASHIANILWPTRARATKRGETLRDVLKLDGNHALNDKRLQTLWEHADERLDDWIQQTKGEKIAFDFIGPKAQLPSGATSDLNLYRLYDPQQLVFYYRGKAFHFQGLSSAVADVASRVLSAHKQLFPDQHKEEAATAAEAPAEAAPEPQAKPEAPKPAAKRTTRKAPAKKTTARKTSARKTTTRKPAARKTAAAKKTTAAKSTAAKKPARRRTTKKAEPKAT
ncbi:MAG: hypothetical protein MI755_20955 [Sphingomonadales bacterium]|nr:hypothetical protein [Sphingomonadales bacterium]